MSYALQVIENPCIAEMYERYSHSPESRRCTTGVVILPVNDGRLTAGNEDSSGYWVTAAPGLVMTTVTTVSVLRHCTYRIVNYSVLEVKGLR